MLETLKAAIEKIAAGYTKDGEADGDLDADVANAIDVPQQAPKIKKIKPYMTPPCSR